MGKDSKSSCSAFVMLKVNYNISSPCGRNRTGFRQSVDGEGSRGLKKMMQANGWMFGSLFHGVRVVLPVPFNIRNVRFHYYALQSKEQTEPEKALERYSAVEESQI